MEGKRGVFDTNLPQQTLLQPLPAVDAGSFGVVLITGKHVCMFRMHRYKSTRAHANEIDHNLIPRAYQPAKRMESHSGQKYYSKYNSILHSCNSASACRDSEVLKIEPSISLKPV